MIRYTILLYNVSDIISDNEVSRTRKGKHRQSKHKLAEYPSSKSTQTHRRMKDEENRNRLPSDRKQRVNMGDHQWEVSM